MTTRCILSSVPALLQEAVAERQGGERQGRVPSNGVTPAASWDVGIVESPHDGVGRRAMRRPASAVAAARG